MNKEIYKDIGVIKNKWIETKNDYLDMSLNIISDLQQENKELHNKIDKAIEYCDKTKEPYEEYYGESFEEYDWVVDIARDLLEILKGDVDE